MESFSDDHDHGAIKLYAVYWKIVLEDILINLGFETTANNKMILHDFHKRVLGFSSIANKNKEFLSDFLFRVGVFWSEQGFFIRTRKDQPIDIAKLPLSECWRWL